MYSKQDSRREAAYNTLVSGKPENIARHQESRIGHHHMAGVYLRRDAWNSRQTARILRYVDGLIEESGGENIDRRLPKGGPRKLPRGNNWEG